MESSYLLQYEFKALMPLCLLQNSPNRKEMMSQNIRTQLLQRKLFHLQCSLSAPFPSHGRKIKRIPERTHGVATRAKNRGFQRVAKSVRLPANGRGLLL